MSHATDITDVPTRQRLSRCGELLGATPPMHRLFEQIRRVAPLDVTVFVHGESGTGKELAARALHQYSGRRGRLVAVNCGAVAPELLSSQLFGHERGSFTGAVKDHAGFFEQAHQGTIFLDEITEMPRPLQTHLLRVLESREVTPLGASRSKGVDIRVIAATNRDPEQAVAEGQLRHDLYYRLMDFPLAMPALREHPGDIPILASHLLERLNERYGTARGFADDALPKLVAYAWPGNVRELKNVIRRSYVLAHRELRIELKSEPWPEHANGQDVRFSVGMKFEEIEKQMLIKTLAHFGNDKTRTAEALGISLKTIYNKLSRYQARAS